MTGNEIRSTFLKFFADRGHRIVNGIQSLVERISEHAQSWQQMRGRIGGEYQNKPY